MPWSWLEGVSDAGALGPPARSFAAREIGADPGRGAPALLALARAIEGFAGREASAEEEARFVEGAGAFFGVVLVEHLGNAGHAARDGVHRVRLGTHGFFDPFGVVTEALARGPAKRVLVEATRMAELEARGRGGIARAALAFERALEEEDRASGREPVRAVTGRFDRSLSVGDVEVDLTRVIEATVGESDAMLERSVRKLVEMLPGGRGSAVSRGEADERLLPRVVGSNFADEGAVVTMPLAPDLRVALVLAYEGRARFVRPTDLDGWELTAERALDRAVANLGARAKPPRIAHLTTDQGPMLVASTRDGLDSARILLPGVRALFARELGEPYLLGVPHRDVLLGCASGAPALAAAFAARVADDSARAPHAISARVYRSEEVPLRLP